LPRSRHKHWSQTDA